jgi:hypothetical protein
VIEEAIQARASIVVNESASGLYRQAAEELQRYIGKLTGVQLRIVGPHDVHSGERISPCYLVGARNKTNSLVGKAAESELIGLHKLNSEDSKDLPPVWKT